MTVVRSEALEFRKLAPAMAGALGDFFERLSSTADASFFHPHPLTHEWATQLCHYAGQDLYFAAVSGSSVLAYGMLRGWDDGYAVPSLGIALAPEVRGMGLAQSFMRFLHSAARLRGSTRIRLTVFRSNVRAVALYERLGYRWTPKNAEEDIGTLDLGC